MKNKIKNYILIGIAILLFLFMFILSKTTFKDYVYIVFVFIIIDFVSLYFSFSKNKTPETYFKSKIKNILNTYESILAKIDDLPNLIDKDIVFISKFEELVNIQGETKKPIFYKVSDNTAAFILIDNNLVCATVLKEQDSMSNEIESKLLDYKEKKRINDIDESILADLEKTTIIKLPNTGTYKVSPIKKNKEDNDLKLDVSEESNITKEIIDEVSQDNNLKLDVSEESNITKEIIDEVSHDNNLKLDVNEELSEEVSSNNKFNFDIDNMESLDDII